MRSINLNILLLLFVFTSFLSSISNAQKASAGAMVLFGSGSMGGDATIPSRSMIYTPVILFAGYNIKKFRLGLNYEYNLAGQSQDAASVGNVNMGGKGTNMGLRLDYYDGKQSVGLIYALSQKYTCDKPTVTGSTATYDGISGFGFQYYRQFKNRIGFVIDFTSGSMKNSVPGTSDVNWSRAGIGLVFTNFGGK